MEEIENTNDYLLGILLQSNLAEKQGHGNRLIQLKIVTMILYEVLRLYPPVLYFNRVLRKDMKVGNVLLTAGTQVSLPIILIHQDNDIWGDDAKEFKPERFAEGIAKATKGQNFSFELSPNYAHVPNMMLTLQPKNGATIILHKL
ncbi:hypothetical protein P8452_74662 [Trifolium repens]|nr:hypothetical protein P8452_74662 [Trifolium repens]